MSKNQNIRRKKQNVPKAASAARPKPIKRRPAIKAALRKRPNGKLYAAILAGGIGSRFWPLSRETTPKQLLKVVGDESLPGLRNRAHGQDHRGCHSPCRHRPLQERPGRGHGGTSR